MSDKQEPPGGPDQTQGEPQDETHRRFEEALERKRQQSHATVPGVGRSVNPHTSDKRQRTFRRKSG